MRRLLERLIAWGLEPVTITAGEWTLVETSASLDPHDVWIGAYWKRSEAGVSLDPWAKADRDAYRRLGGLVVTRVDVYVCVLPMLPLRFVWLRRRSVLEPNDEAQILDAGPEYG